MRNSLIRTGHGYKDCTAFDGFTIIAAPLPGNSAAEREARVFRRSTGNGTDYSSHVLALAVLGPNTSNGYEGGRSLYLLVSHGGGREVWSLPSFYDGGDYERALLALPERLLYAALYTLYSVAADARREGVSTTAATYRSAFVEGRLKKSRPRKGRVLVTIQPREAPTVAATFEV